MVGRLCPTDKECRSEIVGRSENIGPQGLVVALVHGLQSPVQKVLERQTLRSTHNFATTFFIGWTKTSDHSEDLKVSKVHTWNTVLRLESNQLFESKCTLDRVAIRKLFFLSL